MKQFLDKITNNESLGMEEMEVAARQMFEEGTSDTEIGAFLTGLKVKGETADEIAGLVNVIREKSMTLPSSIPGVMDNCGTGGDGSQSFNVSTTSAFVIAGAGVTVAKHGNRSISSKTGSADVLEHLGVSLALTPEQTHEALKENGIAFLFAPHVHPALKRMMKVRKDLRIPTIFNLIGPLTNPVELTTQLLGIYRRDMLERMANVLHRLGRKRALILNGAGHMDEASLAGENHLVLLERGEIMQFTLSPEEVGLPVYSNEAIIGGDSKQNAEILYGVLNGEKGAYRDTVLMNAGLGIFANGKAETVQDGVKLAKESIDSGAALSKLEYLIDFSSRTKQEV
ncbi:anthranilate phosphoribosyltransferase [Aquibacillus koreensis]|uniref:Anthranilate phosphoribosyltransferase n=1 Tax=Aquibacillus koreensis TaxID=279446 RepID=A0A9X3WP43_9BACI|nr:anthranilate phosphoribosyltransferase [Aquibacillus koreensis]MCT2538187.1 anthranilate phosphoribosyltransferase [Aquibacillus koreensis]MDC3420869.1 anthranilate phosphoribosyltransferase [Aquibacillus koreensis]